jgi:hypothetical protein
MTDNHSYDSIPPTDDPGEKDDVPNTEESSEEIKRQNDGSITGSIDIRKLEQLDFSSGVSEKLPFLKNGSGKDADQAEDRGEQSELGAPQETLMAEKIKTLIEFSGEYQCLSCNKADFFLKGCRFHSCSNPDCKDKEKGWDPVFILF